MPFTPRRWHVACKSDKTVHCSQDKPGETHVCGDRGWDGWMASPTQWTWTWANSGRWLGTGRPGVLQSMGSQRRWTRFRDNNNKCFLRTPFKFTHGRMHLPINLISLKTEPLNHHNNTEETLDHVCSSPCIRRKSSGPTTPRKEITGGHEDQGGGGHRALPEAAHRPAFLDGRESSHRAREWCLHELSSAQLLSRARLFATPWTAAHQAPLSMGFSRQGYWSKLACPSPTLHVTAK